MPASEMGPLVTKQHLDKVRGYVDAGVAEGATLVADGRDARGRRHANGFFLGPCLFDHVKPTMTIYKDEIFGPVLSMTRVATYDEAIALVNKNPYANGVAIFTNDGGAARKFQHEVEVGMVGINVPIPVPMAYYSFGGWKASLFGDHPHLRPRRRALLHAHQGRDVALARSASSRRRPGVPAEQMKWVGCDHRGRFGVRIHAELRERRRARVRDPDGARIRSTRRHTSTPPDAHVFHGRATPPAFDPAMCPMGYSNNTMTASPNSRYTHHRPTRATFIAQNNDVQRRSSGLDAPRRARHREEATADPRRARRQLRTTSARCSRANQAIAGHRLVAAHR